MVAATSLWACSAAPSNGPDASAGGSPGGSPGASSRPTAVPTPVGSAGQTIDPSPAGGQTDTAWGRIWDQLPAGFPEPSGATASEPIGRGASSAELAVGAAPNNLAGFYVTALPGAGYPIVAQQGPLEDGSRIIDAAGAEAGCKLQVTITPLSGVTHVTIFFGASCPFR